ncbi:hypothetical protein D3C78_1076500 [compost metagenome]
MASSTTMPMASTRPSSEKVLIEKPSSGNTAKVPISATGTARVGIRVARTFCRKMNTTTVTMRVASNSVWTISSMPAETGLVVSSEITYSTSCGKRSFIRSIPARMFSATSRPLASGNW